MIGNLLLSDVTKNQPLVYDPKNTYSYVVVSPQERLSSNNSALISKTKNRLGIIRNYNAVLQTEITDWNSVINYTDSSTKYLPSNWLLAPMQKMFQNNYFDNNFKFAQTHTITNYAFALSRFQFNNLDSSNSKYFKQNKAYQVQKIGDINPFDLSPQELQVQAIALLTPIHDFLKQNLNNHQLATAYKKFLTNSS